MQDAVACTVFDSPEISEAMTLVEMFDWFTAVSIPAFVGVESTKLIILTPTAFTGSAIIIWKWTKGMKDSTRRTHIVNETVCRKTLQEVCVKDKDCFQPG